MMTASQPIPAQVAPFGNKFSLPKWSSHLDLSTCERQNGKSQVHFKL